MSIGEPKFEHNVQGDQKEGELKRGQFRHDFRDGTVNFYETEQELKEAIEEENENRD
jgi:hypothetical protein